MGSYHYSYDIHSEDTGDMKYHKESRDGDRVRIRRLESKQGKLALSFLICMRV